MCLHSFSHCDREHWSRWVGLSLLDVCHEKQCLQSFFNFFNVVFTINNLALPLVGCRKCIMCQRSTPVGHSGQELTWCISCLGICISMKKTGEQKQPWGDPVEGMSVLDRAIRSNVLFSVCQKNNKPTNNNKTDVKIWQQPMYKLQLKSEAKSVKGHFSYFLFSLRCVKTRFNLQ